MLPTPRSQDAKHSNATAFELKRDPGKDLLHVKINRILPTPQARDHKNSNTTQEITPRMKRKLEQGWTIDLNDRIAMNPVVEDTTIAETVNHAIPIVLQSKTDSIINIVLDNVINSDNWGSRLVLLQWTIKPLYSILRKNGSGKDGKKQFAVLHQISPSPINSQSELLPTPNTMEGLDPKSKESILEYNAKHRPGRSYATSNLRERLAYGLMEEEMAKLLPTPCSQESGNAPETYIDGRRNSGNSDFGMGLTQKIAMLPTPNTTDGQNHIDTSPRHTPSLQTVLADKLLPTPRAEEHYQGKGAAKAYADAGFKYPTIRNGKERKGGKGRTHDTNLSTVIDATNLLPTPTSGRADQELSPSQMKRDTWNVVQVIHAVGMLPTPTTADGGKISSQPNYGQKCLANHPAFVGYPDRPKMTKSRKGEKMLPTPTTDNGHERSPEYWQNREGKHQIDLQGMIGVIPTPMSRDWKGSSNQVTEKGRNPETNGLPDIVEQSKSGERTGMKLQPEFTLWMMGFPTEWLDL